MSNGKITSLGSTQSKEMIYIDVDDEITGIIERVANSKAKVVALVLPKRSTVMQSVVNMKLLKRSADSVGKNIVLITSESALMPIAGMAGLHVATTPNSRPIIPEVPRQLRDDMVGLDDKLNIVDGNASEETDEFDSSASANTPIGELASSEPDSILMSEDDESEEDEDEEAAGDDKKPQKSLKVPNFNKFRWGIVIVILLLALGSVGWVYATIILPKAGIAITTDTATINTSLNLTLDTAAKTLDEENMIVPATVQSISKNVSEEVPATGQQNNGVKASGKITIVASICTLPAKKPADLATGSPVTNNGHTYITQEAASFASDPKLSTDGSCVLYTSNSVDITALKAGTVYNTEEDVKFAVKTNYTATGSATGGTDDIVKIVVQSDIDAAKAKVTAQNTDEVQQELESAIKAKGFLAVPSTTTAGEQQMTSDVAAGAKADKVKVTVTTPYTMLGIKEEDLKTLVLADLEGKIDEKRQKILEDGMEDVKFSQENVATSSYAIVTAKVRSVVGPQLNVAAIKKQVVGMKSADIKELITQTPGVNEVKVAYSPFWVTKAPKDVTKITVYIDGVQR